MFDRNTDIKMAFLQYFDDLQAKHTINDISKLDVRITTRLFSKDKDCPDIGKVLPNEMKRASDKFKQDIESYFKEKPIQLDKNNFYVVVNIIQKNFLDATLNLKEALEIFEKAKWPNENISDEISTQREHCKRNIYCSYLTMAFKQSLEAGPEDQAVLISQLITLTITETAPVYGKPVKNVHDFFSLPAESMCSIVFENLHDTAKGSLHTQDLIAIYNVTNNYPILTRFIQSINVPIIGERRSLLNEIKELAKTDEGMNRLVATCKDNENPINKLLVVARNKEDKGLTNLCYKFISENSVSFLQNQNTMSVLTSSSRLFLQQSKLNATHDSDLSQSLIKKPSH